MSTAQAIATPRVTTRILQLLAVIWLVLAGRIAAQTTVSVSGLANIYGSGFGSTPGGGVVSVEYLLPAGTSVVTFTNVTGSASFDTGTGAYYPADGGTGWGARTEVTTLNSLSGITHTDRTVFLTGVFLDAATPTGSAPATLSYNISSAQASVFSPLLQQVFFVGDGLDAVSGTQIFNVPTGATRLYLGFADAWNGSWVAGSPGYYADNGGTLSVTINAIPEPATVSLLLGLGASALAVWRRRVDRSR